MKETVAALRQAALFGIPKESKDRFRELADRLEKEPDWKGLFLASLVKYGANREPGHDARGHAMFGAGTIEWAHRYVELEFLEDPGAVVVNWKAPALKPKGV